MAGEVGRDPGVHERQRGPDAVGHVVTDQLAVFGVGGQEGHEGAADGARDEQADDEDGALVEAAGGIGRADDGDDGDSARGDREEGRLFGSVAESECRQEKRVLNLRKVCEGNDHVPLDNGSLITADRSIRHVHRGHDQTQHPGMRVLQALQGLFGLEMLVLNTGLVFPQSLNRPDLLVVRQAGAHRVVWKEEHDNDTDDNGDEAHDQEENLP